MRLVPLARESADALLQLADLLGEPGVLRLQRGRVLRERTKRGVRDAIGEARADLGRITDPVGGQKAAQAFGMHPEHLGDDGRLIAGTGSVEEGAPVVGKGEETLCRDVARTQC